MGASGTVVRRFAAVGACLLAGCSAPKRAADQPPADFALSVTLVGDAPAGSSLTPGWYVLEADGALRAAMGERTAMSVVPPIVRQLTDAERARVWNAAVESGALTAPTGGVQVAESSLPKSGRGAGVFIAADGIRRTQVIDGDASAFTPMTTVLRELAWADPAK